MLASILKYRIQIYSISTEANEMGELVPTQTLLKRKKAGVKYVSGNETQQTEQTTPIINIRFQIRYDSIINETMKVKYNSEFFDIRYIEKINRDTIFLHCTRINKS